MNKTTSTSCSIDLSTRLTLLVLFSLFVLSQHEVEANFVIRPKSILMTRCQQCGKEYEEPSSSLSSSSSLCFECHEKKELSNPFVSTIDADVCLLSD